jgi:hypothetical protein
MYIKNKNFIKLLFLALAASRSGHRIRLGTEDSGSNSPSECNEHRYRVFKENIAMLLCVIHLMFVVCVLNKSNKGLGPKILKTFLSFRPSWKHMLHMDVPFSLMSARGSEEIFIKKKEAWRY